MQTIREWMLAHIQDKATERSWADLPTDFEVDAVHAIYKHIKPHFDKRDIRARITASRARTFQDLRYAIELMLYL